ncbi:MAG: hypothetical protein ACP5JU_02445 [Minisyncoccia bacterium]
MRRRKTRRIKKINFDYRFFLIFILIILIFALTQIRFLKINVSDNSVKIKDLYILYYIFFKKDLADKIFDICDDAVRVKFKPNFIDFSLNIDLEKEKPVAIICSSDCYYLGSYSYIYKDSIKNEYFPIFSQLKILRNSYLDPLLTDAFSKIFEYSNLNSIILKSGEILSNKDIKIVLKDGKEILFDPNKNIDEEIKKLHYFLTNYKNSYSRIDLRIPGKLYFK